MEIVTTVQELPKEIQKLHLKPDRQVRVIVEEPRTSFSRDNEAEPYLPFLDGEVWQGDENSPVDISANVDHYLYDLNDSHGRD